MHPTRHRQFLRRLVQGALAAGLIFVAVWLADPGPAGAPIAVGFDGLTTTVSPDYPYGRFSITNCSLKPIDWDATVEAPLDPRFEFQQGLSSFRGGGTLPPGTRTQFQMLVAGKPGVRFRLVVHLREPPRFLTRLWIGAGDAFPLLKRVWDPPRLRLRPVYGDWILAPARRIDGGEAALPGGRAWGGRATSAVAALARWPLRMARGLGFG